VSENPNNPGNHKNIDVTTFPGTYSACDAVSACIDFAWNIPGSDYNTDLHWLITEQMWSCICYWDGGSSADYWNIVDSNIGVSYGYEIGGS